MIINPARVRLLPGDTQRHLVQPSAGDLAEFRQNVDAIIIPAETLSGDEGGAASGEVVQDGSLFLAIYKDTL